ncbi:MAG: hypothetical protein LUE17_10290 [Planctomycetaceae bacterium]|nr:hypothetical protein [Planctomycetaceae bacterium]
MRLRSSGKATCPMVMPVATDEPEMAENMAQPMMLAWASPPGMRPSSTARPR